MKNKFFILLAGLLATHSFLIQAKEPQKLKSVLRDFQITSKERALEYKKEETKSYKPTMCYTHIKKWHPCPFQLKTKKEKQS